MTHRPNLAPEVVFNGHANEASWTYFATRRTPRPGADDFLKYPRRMGDRLPYRDGRIEDQPLTTTKEARCQQ